jgi:uncharacterized membrane protein
LFRHKPKLHDLALLCQSFHAPKPLGIINFQGVNTENSTFIFTIFGALLLFVGLVAIFNTARMAYFHTVIIQMGTKLLNEMSSKSDVNRSDVKTDDKNIYIYSNANKPGCLLGLFLPRKKGG